MSFGMEEGVISVEYDYTIFDPKRINLMGLNSFSNNWSVDVPEKLIEILQKVFRYIQKNGLYSTESHDNLTYSGLEIVIDANEESISVLQEIHYLEESDGSSYVWNLKNDSDNEDFVDVIQDLMEEFGDEYESLSLSYNGSGDSGYLENSFEEGESVPEYVLDWCYDELESNFGGWEINEGSQGRFDFDLESGKVEVHHTYNENASKSDTIWEEKFGLSE